MATSPSLACERKWTSRVNASDGSLAKSRRRQWGGTNSSLRAPESTGTICSTSTHKRALSTRCHHGVTDSPVGPGLPSPCPEPSVGFPIPPPAPLLSPRKSKPYTISCLHFSGWVSHNKMPSVCSWSAPEILRGCVGQTHTHPLQQPWHGDTWALHCKAFCKESHGNDNSFSLQICCMHGLAGCFLFYHWHGKKAEKGKRNVAAGTASCHQGREVLVP